MATRNAVHPNVDALERLGDLPLETPALDALTDVCRRVADWATDPQAAYARELEDPEMAAGFAERGVRPDRERMAAAAEREVSVAVSEDFKALALELAQCSVAADAELFGALTDAIEEDTSAFGDLEEAIALYEAAQLAWALVLSRVVVPVLPTEQQLNAMSPAMRPAGHARGAFKLQRETAARIFDELKTILAELPTPDRVRRAAATLRKVAWRRVYGPAFRDGAIAPPAGVPLQFAPELREWRRASARPTAVNLPFLWTGNAVGDLLAAADRPRLEREGTAA